MDASFKEVVTRKLIHYLPSPTPWGEVEKAVAVARRMYQDTTGQRPDDGIPTIQCHDNEVWIFFEVEVRPEDLNKPSLKR